MSGRNRSKTTTGKSLWSKTTDAARNAFHRGEGTNKSKVFGAPIEPNASSVPMVVRKCVEYFDQNGVATEGIFRISGNQNDVLAWRDRFDRQEDCDLLTEADPHVVAGLLRLYVRMLPEPLCTIDLYTMFIASVGIPDEDVKVVKLRQVLDMLPLGNRVLLKYLCRLLERVVAQAANNRMDARNLAVVFAPNVLAPEAAGAPISAGGTPIAGLGEMAGGTDAVRSLVEYTPHSNSFFEFLLSHVDVLLGDVPDPVDPGSSVAVSGPRLVNSTSASARSMQSLTPSMQSLTPSTPTKPLPPIQSQSYPGTSTPPSGLSGPSTGPGRPQSYPSPSTGPGRPPSGPGRPLPRRPGRTPTAAAAAAAAPLPRRSPSESPRLQHSASAGILLQPSSPNRPVPGAVRAPPAGGRIASSPGRRPAGPGPASPSRVGPPVMRRRPPVRRFPPHDGSTSS